MRRHDAHPVRGPADLLVGRREHLGGPDQVEALQPGNTTSTTSRVVTASHPHPAGRWQQCQIPHRSRHAASRVGGSRRWPPDGSRRAPPGPSTSAACGRRMLAWLFARSGEAAFLLRIEDLDPTTSSAEHEAGQLADLGALGARLGRPRGAAVGAARRARGGARRPGGARARPTRASAAAARSARPARRRTRPPACIPARAATWRRRRSPERVAEGRPAALRLRGGGEPVTIVDRLRGTVTQPADDIVLRRNDGVPAYHVAVVVDDDAPGRGGGGARRRPPRGHAQPGPPARPARPAPAGLGARATGARSRRPAPRQATRLRRPSPTSPPRVWTPRRSAPGSAASLGLAEPGEPVTMAELLDRFDPTALPREPWIYP